MANTRVEYIDSIQNWSPAPGAKWIEMIVVGGGAGGGSGALGTTAQNSSGGSGGGPACVSYEPFDPLAFTVPISLQPSPGGLGGAARDVSGQEGLGGAVGGYSYVDVFSSAQGGNGGGGGQIQASSQAPTAATNGTWLIGYAGTNTSTGNNGSPSNSASVSLLASGPTHGGSGGGVSTAVYDFRLGGSSSNSTVLVNPLPVVLGGQSTGADGSNGAGITNTQGCGGGGGASDNTGVTFIGGDGGAGNVPGGGGGGGGCSDYGVGGRSGAGGNGGPGRIIVITYF